jgi:probable rRNA maturation factor
MIHILDNHKKRTIDPTKLKSDIKTILNALDYNNFDITVVLATDEEMHEYNKTYRHQDKVTDILSFPFYPNLKAGERIQARDKDEKILGDIILAPDYIQKDLERWGVTFDQRIRDLIVHGTLHLLGYDHIEDSDYEIMKEREQWLLQQLH